MEPAKKRRTSPEWELFDLISPISSSGQRNGRTPLKAAEREAPRTPIYEHHVIGNAMDPRFKLMGSFSPLKAAEATERLVTECGALIRTPEAVQPQESPSTSRPEQEAPARPTRTQDLDEALVNLIVKDTQPFSVVED
ncbi:hypothetical protein KUCAC02_022105, partial [Chaenocephalus aceratus]